MKFESAHDSAPRRLFGRGGAIAVFFFKVSRALEAQVSISSRNYVKFESARDSAPRRLLGRGELSPFFFKVSRSLEARFF